MTTLVLASASPARLKTLRQAGIEPVVLVSDVDEDVALDAARTEAALQGERLTPSQAVLALARAKAQAVAVSAPLPDALVLGCDSMLELDGQILGKPETPQIAFHRWQAMRGRSGVLHTGHWLVDTRQDAQPASTGATDSTVVHFADLTDAEIKAYVATGEPLKVAGAFTVDGLGGPYVTGIEGDYHNVVGLSLPLLRRLLLDHGIGIHSLRDL